MGERVEGETFVLSRGRKTRLERKKSVERIYAVASGATDKKRTNASVFFFSVALPVGITHLAWHLNERGLGRNSERGTPENDAYDIGLSHTAILLHCTSPTHVYKVHFSGCTPIIKLYILRNNSDGASLFSGTL